MGELKSMVIGFENCDGLQVSPEDVEFFQFGEVTRTLTCHEGILSGSIHCGSVMLKLKKTVLEKKDVF